MVERLLIPYYQSEGQFLEANEPSATYRSGKSSSTLAQEQQTIQACEKKTLRWYIPKYQAREE